MPRRAWVHLVLWGLALIVILGVMGFAAGVAITDRLEQDNRFCIACHVPRMIQIYENSQPVEGRPITLAGAHHVKRQVKCIECHIGADFKDKMVIKAIAAKDTVKYLLGLFKDPHSLSYPLGDRTCLKCHPDGGQNPKNPKSFHNAPYHRDPRNTCSDCHRSHDEASAETLFLRQELVKPLCESCHLEILGL